MKILVTGNTGYIGPVLGEKLKQKYNDLKLIGFDTGFFAHCLTGVNVSPELNYDVQYYGDIRKLDKNVFHGVDIVIHLAAISNDPMGNNFASVTEEINSKASENVAKMQNELVLESLYLPLVAVCMAQQTLKQKKRVTV